MLEKTMEFLLEHACVNIRYMINRDVKKIAANEPFMREMQDEILNQKFTQKIFASQHDDGWFGYELHGQPGNAMDSSVSFLLMYGVDPSNERLQKAKRALLDPEISSKHENYMASGDALDADGRGGNRAIMVDILAKLKESEANPLLAEEIALSLKHFDGALEHSSVDDFTIIANNKNKTRYYKPNALFPGWNHIDLLAKTQGWRTKENMDMVINSMEHCIDLMQAVTQFPTLKKRPPYGNSYIGPFNFDWHVFNVKDLKSFSRDSNGYRCVFWLRTLMEFGELSIANDISIIKQQYTMLAELLETDRLYNEISEKDKTGFKRMAIEPSWRNETSQKCDICFSAYKAVCSAGLRAV